MNNSVIKEERKHTGNDLEKKVIIFDMVFSFITDKGLLQTQQLVRKLNILAQKNNNNFAIETYNSNKVDQYGPKADLLFLTPTFGYAKEEIQNKFPETPVIALSKKEYGLLDAETLYQKILVHLS